MPRYALLDAASVVTNTLDISDPSLSPTDIRPGTTGWVAVGANVENGWIKQEDGSFASPASLPPTQTGLIAYANGKQWALATGGYTTSVNGSPIRFDTSVESCSLITGKAARLQQANPPISIIWQTGPSAFVTLAASDFVTIAIAIADFVQQTFDALHAVVAAIQAGSITSFAEVDAANWPQSA